MQGKGLLETSFLGSAFGMIIPGAHLALDIYQQWAHSTQYSEQMDFQKSQVKSQTKLRNALTHRDSAAKLITTAIEKIKQSDFEEAIQLFEKGLDEYNSASYEDDYKLTAHEEYQISEVKFILALLYLNQLKLNDEDNYSDILDLINESIQLSKGGSRKYLLLCYIQISRKCPRSA